MGRLTDDYREYLLKTIQSPREMATYLDAALEQGDREALMVALRDVADALGVTKLANWANLNRENLYRMLSASGNPRLDSLERILKPLDLRLGILAIRHSKTARQPVGPSKGAKSARVKRSAAG